MHQVRGGSGLQLRLRSLVQALAYHLWWTEEIGWCGYQVRKPHCFWGTLTTNSVEIVSTTFVQYSDPCPVLCFVAFRSRLVGNFLLNLDPYGGNDPDGTFSIFYKQVAWELAPKLAVIFRHLVRGASFPAFCRLANVVLVPKRSYFSDAEDCRPIAITPVLSTVVEKIVNEKLSHFLKGNSLLPPSQFSYRRDLVTCLCSQCVTTCR